MSLQWGRNILVAESRVPSIDTLIRFLLQWGRNILVAESGLVDHLLLLRIRASMGPQHTRCGKCGLVAVVVDKYGLQWGRNILVAESQKGRHENCICRSFNGAATYSLRKGRGPRPCSGSWSSFNGAATYSLRKASAPTDGRTRGARFNGAATYSLRKDAALGEFSTGLKLLQWGRNILVAESNGPLGKAYGHPPASMGPQHTRCGKLTRGALGALSMP